MQKKNEIIEFEEFSKLYNENQRPSFGGWLLKTVFVASTSYFWNYSIGTTQEEEIPQESCFVVMNVVEEKMNEFIKYFRKEIVKNSDLYVTPFQIKEFFANYNPIEIKIILYYLHSKNAIMVKLSNENIVNKKKF
jgi:hypothetical protein